MLVKKTLSPLGLAVIFTVLLTLWLVLGDKKAMQDSAPEAQNSAEQSLTKVEYRLIQAKLWHQQTVLQGQLEPWQSVVVKAQVSGQVEQFFKSQGDSVSEKEPLLKLSDEGREDQLAEAKTAIALRQLELSSAQKLKTSSLIAETELERASLALAQAQSQKTQARLAVQYGKPKAPFSGIVNHRFVDLGEWLSPADPIMEVVDISKLRVTAYVPQQEIQKLKVGQSVGVELLDGRQLNGQLTFISFSADTQTRSFYIEAEVDNKNQLRVSGSSATLRVQLPPVKAHRISPALLNLDSSGRLGVYAVDEANKVIFYSSKDISADNEGATVIGLPDELRIITLGTGYVELGQQVQAVEAQP